MNLLLHPHTKNTLETLQAEPPQSLLISGAIGVGLHTIATWFAGATLAGIIQPQDTKGHADGLAGTISVEMIRALYDQTRSKHTSRRTIIIDNADRMSKGAQGAFLKLLEEPSPNTYFLLTSHTPQQLLPTIRSRVQHATVRPISMSNTLTLLKKLAVTDATKSAQLQFIAAGLPAELTRLVQDEAYFIKRAKIMGDARDFLQADVYKKLLIAQKYRSNRSEALRLLDSALSILRRSMSAKPQQTLVAQLERLLEVREHIMANYNITLQLARFVL